MIQKKYLLIFLLFFYHNTEAQEKNFKIPDSLMAKSFDYFSESIMSHPNDSIRAMLYAKTWIKKAKSEGNLNQAALAYRALIHFDDKSKKLEYADSMVIMAKRTADLKLLGAAYMTKGIVYYDLKEHSKALDNYLIADEYISKTEDSYTEYKIKYGIANTKYYLGFYHEAIALFKQCIEYFKEENDRAYLNSLHSLGLCYNKIGEYKLCTQTNQMGLKVGLQLENAEMIPYFNHSEGINQYYTHQYKTAIKKISESLPGIIDNKDFANETVAYFYIGKSYWSQNQHEKAISYFKKVDRAFDKQNYTRPDLREAYELLIDYYRQKNNKDLQLYYINKLLKIDRVLEKDYKYLSGKIHREYDTKKLLQTKLGIEQSLKYRTIAGCSIIAIMSFVIFLLFYRHFKNKKLFKELMERKPATLKPLVSGNTTKDTELDINPEVIAAVLKSLEKFEKNKKYLEKDMTLVKIASLLNTNTKYVSKIVAKYREKGTIEYISDLKIDYIIELLKNESKYRNYTNKALGEEAGFGSTQNFTRAFNNRTGLSPTYFIHRLKTQYP